jgi:hypothetical protein
MRDAGIVGAHGGAGLGAPVPAAARRRPGEEAIHDFNTLVLWIIVAITIFVMGLLAYCIWRFRASANPTPSRTSHNTTLEIAWTVVPVLILLVIAIPSFRLIYYEDRARDADLTINVQGRQWYWHYAYPDNGDFAFDSRPVADEDLKPGQPRNLAVDEPLVIPTGANIRVLTTGQDVIHSFLSRRSACRSTRSRAGRWRPGSARTGRASITASATRSAEPTTGSCRSWSAPCRRPSSRPGSRRPRRSTRRMTARRPRLAPASPS